jgi:hypothetical protein
MASEDPKLPTVRSIAWLDLLGVVSMFGVFGQLTMVAVTLEENPET